MPELVSVRQDVTTFADTAGRLVARPRLLRIPDRMFRRNVDIARPLHAERGTSNARGANWSRAVPARVRLVSQEPFVCVAAVTVEVADTSELG